MVDEEAWAGVPVGEPRAWPQVIRAGVWVAPDGTTWHRRGGELTSRQLKKLMAQDGVLLLHVAGPVPVLAEGQRRASVLDRLTRHLAGEAPRHVSFDAAEFRDDSRRTLLVVEETC